jgi:hypothetical protein
VCQTQNCESEYVNVTSGEGDRVWSCFKMCSWKKNYFDSVAISNRTGMIWIEQFRFSCILNKYLWYWLCLTGKFNWIYTKTLSLIRKEYFVSATFIRKGSAVICLYRDWNCLQCGCMFVQGLELSSVRWRVCTGTGTVFIAVTSQRSNRHPKEEIDYVNAYQILGHQKCLLFTGTEHFQDCTQKAVFTDHKISLIKKITNIQSFSFVTVTNYCKYWILIIIISVVCSSWIYVCVCVHC